MLVILKGALEGSLMMVSQSISHGRNVAINTNYVSLW